MAARYELRARITSAADLKNVNWRHGQLKPYAVVWVEPENKCSTYSWNQKLFIPFRTSILESTLHIDLMHDGGIRRSLLIGSARIPLFGIGPGSFAAVELKRPSGRPQGVVKVEYSVGELGSGGTQRR